MKKSIIVFSAVALLACSTSFAQESSKKTVKAKTTKKIVAPKVEGAAMLFENETIDYGTIAQNADGKREFVFTNNGNKPLIITNATGSCGCTVPTFTKEPIMPGGKGVIGVKYATDRTGAFSKTVTVTSNAAVPSKTLTIKGNVLVDPATKEAPKS